MSVGLVFPPERGIEHLASFARAAENAGVDELWLWEDCFGDGGIALAAVALTATTRLTVGTGILPLPLRSVAALAMEATALARLAPGRFALGVGHGVQEWMRQAGVRATSPLTLLREQVAALRSLFAGDAVEAAGRYVTLDGVRLDRPPASSPPLWIAGEGPRTLRVAGEFGDGVLLTAGTSPERTAEAAALAAEGRRAAGRTGAAAIGVFVFTAFASTPAEVEAGWRRLERTWDDWALGDGTRSGAVGSPTEVADQLRAWIDAGATRVLLVPSDAGPSTTADAAEVARRLRS